jgi:MoaA/NifB/PqqE/SkfB family radical SAM enzyme
MLSPLRFARAGARILAANVARPAAPVKLNWCLTYWCQYKCQTCNIWQRKPVDELSTDEVLTVVARNPSPSWLDLTGGELFLRKDIDDILDAIVSQWRDVVFLHYPTNGFLTDRIVASTRRIAGRVPRLVVTVSLDGDEALNDRIRGIRGGYVRQIETFRRLRELSDVRPVFGMTLSSLNVGRFEETFAAVRRDCPGIEIGDFHLNVAQTSDHYYGNAGAASVHPPRSGVRDELAKYSALKGRPRSLEDWVESVYLRRMDDYLDTGHTPMRCHSLRSSCFIDPWGTVYPCITYSHAVGSLRDTSYRLAEVWDAPATRDLQQEIWRGECPQCWTACEAYQSILGNAVMPGRRTRGAVPPEPERQPRAAKTDV